MFTRSRLLNPRLPVALFNMKHFQCRQRVDLNPSNYSTTLNECLHPQDRLLRQSAVGGGASRVLVVDKMQQVKAVMIPMLCAPHPTVLSSLEETTLGIPIEKYLSGIKPVPKPKAKSSNTVLLPTSLVILSHPNGLAVGIFNSDGKYVVKLQNITIVKDEAVASPVVQAITNLVQTLTDHKKAVSECSTLYFVVRDNTDSLTLAAIEALAAKEPSLQGSFDFKDRRWVSMADVVFHHAKGVSLYARDPKTNAKIVSADGLQTAVKQGRLELGFQPKKKESPDTPKQG
ncbi:hypothetical protein STCU_02567 [Strigomonas culicis]|uniref:Uncharacterized protein n=1 Tax=Strigomonas culicis TaxID=28005 RepID=S9VWN5_9TRYP|nr:hypothetical protein STCU_05359 [Strigomonas culicis]EPY31721.1 hypothetical protein STCU_03304 [Strigomonas culicis]EPY32943.1 hypothetical protein STCU_02567 [Strigomonas culicis]|eukprot:EPY27985.1 hypothetical protein STCU_05359 [Strigomonas culicis]